MGSPNYIVGHDEHGPAYPMARPGYHCPICKGDENRFLTCDYPGCPDGHDQPRLRPEWWDHPDWHKKQNPSSVKCVPCMFISAIIFGAFITGAIFWALNALAR